MHVLTKKLLRLLRGKKVYLLAALLVILLAGGLVYNSSYRANSRPDPKDAKKTNSKIEELKKPEYEVLSQGAAPNKRFTVYVKTQNTKQIELLNKDLKVGFRKTTKGDFYIDYFDDKEVATTFFARANDPKLSLAVKQELVTHYIGVYANMNSKETLLFPAKTAKDAMKRTSNSGDTN